MSVPGSAVGRLAVQFPLCLTLLTGHPSVRNGYFGRSTFEQFRPRPRRENIDQGTSLTLCSTHRGVEDPIRRERTIFEAVGKFEAKEDTTRQKEDEPDT